MHVLHSWAIFFGMQLKILQQMAAWHQHAPGLQVCTASVATISPQDIEEPEAKAAFIWILGHFGQGIQVCLFSAADAAMSSEPHAPEGGEACSLQCSLDVQAHSHAAESL